MLLLRLKKHIPTGKMFVTSWFFVPKNQSTEQIIIHGQQVLIEDKNVPDGFYKTPFRYFYEDGFLRNGFGINEE